MADTIIDDTVEEIKDLCLPIFEPVPRTRNPTTIQIAKCNDGTRDAPSNDYFVYQLPKPSGCPDRYCGMDCTECQQDTSNED